MPLGTQRSFDDLGAPLSEVPFCVVDIETTGGAAADLGITEIGAVRFRGGEPDGMFHTLVNPGAPIPPFITVLTGITQAMVVEAPRIEEMMPAFLEFLGDAVIVGHNVRYDIGFLDAASRALGYGALTNRSVDTLRLARRLAQSEIRDFRLASLAAYFRSPVTPTHRALDDARATAHVLWCLLERAGTIGVTHLDDLLALPTARGRASYAKLDLTDGLPRRPGVYLFRDSRGDIFYVGKAKNLRSRVRSYFYGDTRRSVEQMLRELDSVDHRVCSTELEAEVTELRLIAAHRPRHNRRSKPPKSSHWVRLTRGPFPRLSLARTIAPDAIFHLGPFRGTTAARTVMEALWDAVPIRRCTHRPGSRPGPCSFAQLGTALCPCDGSLREDEYAPIVERLVTGVNDDAGLLLDPLERKVTDLARRSRFEEAAWVRDRHRALARALDRRRSWGAMQRAGMVRAAGPDGGALIERGRLLAAWPDGDRPPLLPAGSSPGDLTEAAPSVVDAEEAHLVWRWLMSEGVRLVEADGPIGLPSRPVARLERIAV
ncbi:MAG TPA: DEDD exonuclease domain-containing protein [Acidimicrobiia bacterium]|nr:DEDD exonuclease domain-containing protein [Acidimicrobiia bacterium]